MDNESKTKVNQISTINLPEETQIDVDRNKISHKQSQVWIRTEGSKGRDNSLLAKILSFKLDPSSKLNGLLGIALIVGMATITVAFTCWPQHNVILYPEYWFEPMLTVNLTNTVCRAGYLVLQARMLLMAQEILTFKRFMFYYFLRVLGLRQLFTYIPLLGWILKFTPSDAEQPKNNYSNRYLFHCSHCKLAAISLGCKIKG